MKKNGQDEVTSLSNRETQRYSLTYRLVKTFLMIATWIAFGLTMEIVGPTFEDLKIRLNLSYKEISFALVLRAVGYIAFAFFSGLFLDKLSKYAEFVMAGATVLRCLRKFFIRLNNYFVAGFCSSTIDFK